jgi:hypothetical protein
MAEEAMEPETEAQACDHVHAHGQPEIEPPDAVVPKDHDRDHDCHQGERDDEACTDQLDLPRTRYWKVDSNGIGLGWRSNGHSNSDPGIHQVRTEVSSGPTPKSIPVALSVIWRQMPVMSLG